MRTTRQQEPSPRMPICDEMRAGAAEVGRPRLGSDSTRTSDSRVSPWAEQEE